MEDIHSVRARHGHFPGKGFWWIDHILVEDKKTMIMVMFGSKIIGDKACYRINDGQEKWFEPATENRVKIIDQGKALLQEVFKGKTVKDLKGAEYTWE